MKKVYVISLDEEFEKARKQGAKDKVPRKKRGAKPWLRTAGEYKKFIGKEKAADKRIKRMKGRKGFPGELGDLYSGYEAYRDH